MEKVGHSRPSVLYRKIVLNESINEEDLSEIIATGEFSFRSVVQGRNHGGLACTCIYRHEYFSHIHGNDDIDLHKLDLLCSNLDRCECPHVPLANLDDHEIVTSSVSVLQVAVAVDNSEVWEKLIGQVHSRGSQSLTTVQVAILKENCSFLEKACTYFDDSGWEHQCSELFIDMIEVHDDDLTNQFIIRPTNAIRLSIEKNNSRLLNCFDCGKEVDNTAIEEAILSGNNQIVLKLISRTVANYSPADAERHISLQRYTLTAVLGENIEILEMFAHFKCIPSKIRYNDQYCFNALDLATMLGHSRCEGFLQSYLEPCENIEKVNPYQIVVDLTRANTEPGPCINLLEKLHARGYDINKVYDDDHGEPVAMSVLKSKILPTGETISAVIHPRIFAELLNLGVDVNIRDGGGRTLLEHCLTAWIFDNPLDILKLCLFHNPTIMHHKEKMYIDLAFKQEYNSFPNPEQYHFNYHLGPPFFSDFAIGLLWECGLRLNELNPETNILESLRQSIIEKKCQPRSLQMLCRNKIRETLPGRCLHQFLQTISYPDDLKEYVLITILLTPNYFKCDNSLPKVLTQNNLVTYSTRL